MLQTQTELFETKQCSGDDDWTFLRAPTRNGTHCFHDYPARMIPQIATKLIDKFGGRAKSLFDPYCGTGTSLVEAQIRNISAIGTDLNPLARLISTSKTTPICTKNLQAYLCKFEKFIFSKPSDIVTPAHINGILNLDFWFKPSVIKRLSVIRHFINSIRSKPVRLFFQTVFSEVVRQSSNTRSSEFTLYRYPSDKLEVFNPDVYALMFSKLERNQGGLVDYMSSLSDPDNVSSVRVYDFNSVAGIPPGTIKNNSVDIVVTSPPYGDSHTTVAYGQYSRLSAAWLDLDEPGRVDRQLMGGIIKKEIPSFSSPTLVEAITNIAEEDKKRAFEVATFYSDLQQSISNVSKTIRRGGIACYVVGNRKVKGVLLPTDDAVRSFFEENSFRCIDTFIRSIPNKRMPVKNSPTNVTGRLEETMTREYIVIMRKR